MGEHKGWLVRAMSDGRFMGRYRVEGTYRSKVFDKEREAERWAMAGAGRVEARVEVVRRVGTAVTDDLVRDYLASLGARGRAAGTLADLGGIFRQLGQVVPDLAASTAGRRIEAWLDDLRVAKRGTLARLRVDPTAVPVDEQTQRASPARRNKYLVNVRALCQWAIRRGLLEKDPTAVLESSSVPSWIRPQFSVEELRQMVACRQHRAWAWVVLMTFAGLRADEAAHVRWRDIDWEGNVLRVALAAGGKVKRNRERLVPIQAELRQILLPMKGPADHRIASIPATNRPRIWRAFLAKAGVAEDGRSPHSLRHSWAGLMTATGLPTALVGAYLGHTAAQTTLGYTRLATRYVAQVQGWKVGTMQLQATPAISLRGKRPKATTSAGAGPRTRTSSSGRPPRKNTGSPDTLPPGPG